MTILVDMDDTIECLLAAWVKVLNERYGRSVTTEDVTDWDVTKAYPGLAKEQVYGVLNEEGVWGRVDPMPGAAEALQRFIAKGHEVYIVTATAYESVAEKMRDLLFRWFPFIGWNNVIIAARKQMIRADVLIDDAVHNMVGGQYAKILVDAPYNRGFDAAAEGMTRVYSWEEIEREVDRLAAAQAAAKPAAARPKQRRTRRKDG